MQEEALHQESQEMTAEHVHQRRMEEAQKQSTCKHKCKDKAACKHLCCKGLGRKQSCGGNLTQLRYLNEILKKHVVPMWEECKRQGKEFMLEEDNDQAHGTRSDTNPVAKCKQEIGLPWYANPPQSPDFCIIGNC